MATGNTYDLSTPPSSFSLAHDLRSGNTYENERHQMIWSWQMILDLEDAPFVSVELMTMASTQMGMSAFRWYSCRKTRIQRDTYIFLIMKRSDFKCLAITTLFQCPPTFDFIGSDFRPLHALIPQVLLGNKQILPNRYVELSERCFQLQNCASHISSTLNWNGKHA
jgi:hypothetical protein